MLLHVPVPPDTAALVPVKALLMQLRLWPLQQSQTPSL